MKWLLWIHDDVYRYGKWKMSHHLCNLLLWNTVLVPPRRKTIEWGGVTFSKISLQLNTIQPRSQTGWEACKIICKRIVYQQHFYKVFLSLWTNILYGHVSKNFKTLSHKPQYEIPHLKAQAFQYMYRFLEIPANEQLSFWCICIYCLCTVFNWIYMTRCTSKLSYFVFCLETVFQLLWTLCIILR